MRLILCIVALADLYAQLRNFLNITGSHLLYRSCMRCCRYNLLVECALRSSLRCFRSNSAFVSSGSAVYFCRPAVLANVEGDPSSACLSSYSKLSCQQASMPLAFDATHGKLVIAGGGPAVVAVDVGSSTVLRLAGACYNSSSSCRVLPWDSAPAVPACLCSTGGGIPGRARVLLQHGWWYHGGCARPPTVPSSSTAKAADSTSL